MQNQMTLEFFIPHAQEGDYLTFPFTMPAGVESFTLRYRYTHRSESERRSDRATFLAQQEINIIDLGLIDPQGLQVGASGSNKHEITITEQRATPGYKPWPLTPGEWRILAGAYKVAPAGVTVTYELEFSFKSRRWFKGDLHTHTLASDGVCTVEELGQRALRHGLDFLAITDHNQMIAGETLPQPPGLTLIQGMEWTHFRGHANFLGVDRPYDAPFAANTFEEVQSRFISARQRGALISINHPYDPDCGFQFDLNRLPFDILEVWNGPMRESNLHALGFWQRLLASGRKIPICGGSDYHRDSPFLFLGGPTTCVYAMSAAPGDILAALQQGHAYITFAPDGPTLSAGVGGEAAILGDSLPWREGQCLQISAEGLIAGDVIRVVTGQGSEAILEAECAGRMHATHPITAPGFARVEIYRAFLPGIPKLPALLSNPIYFDYP